MAMVCFIFFAKKRLFGWEIKVVVTPGSFYFYVDELARFYCYLSSETVRRGGGGG